MIRESLTAESRHATMVGSAAAGFAYQRRVQTAGSSDSSAGPANAPPGWVRLVRKGDLFSAYHSTNGVNWTLIGSDTIPMGNTVYVGVPVTSHSATVTTTAKIDSLKVIAASLPNQPPAVSVTAPIANSQYTVPASITINATATDPEGVMLSVDFYANQTLITRDTTAPYSATFATSTPGAYSLTAVAHDADGNSTTSAALPITVQSASNQVPTVSLTAPANGATFTAPATVGLTANASDPENQMARVEFFSGTTLLGTDTTAPYSFSWTNVAAGTYSLTAKAYDTAGASATSAAVAVTLSATGGGLPAGQIAADVGAPTLIGSTTYSGGLYSLKAGGLDIWDPADQFHFLYQQVSGDLEIVTRVASLTNTHSWAKAGVMVRESLTAGSRHALALVSGGNGYAFQRRSQTGGASSHTTGSAGQAPGWVRLVRTGNVFQAYDSIDGVTWRLIGSATVQMSTSVYVGLAATSHSAVTATTARFDNLRITGGSANKPPVVTLTSPTSGATFSAPATISLTATGSDPENQLARVEFFSGTSLLGTDTSAPYSFSWTNVAAGTYSLMAKAYDAAGASATSPAVTVTVGTTTSPPRYVAFTASSDHATNVTSYVFKVFAAAANPATANPIVSSDLGKPTPNTNNEITVDRSALFNALATGTYIATVTAIGPGGQTQGIPVTFTR